MLTWWAIYSFVGLIFGAASWKHRRHFGGGDGDIPILWLMISSQWWPFMALAPAVNRFDRLRYRVRRRLKSRPPKWYDWLFFWA